MTEKRVDLEKWVAWLKQISWFFYNYTGIRFVVLKFKGRPTNDPNYREPPSGMIWFLGIYIAAFGFADQQYNRAVDAAVLLTQDLPEYPSTNNEDNTCARYTTYLKAVKFGPIEPNVFSPTTVVQSVFGDHAPLMDRVFDYARRAESSAYMSIMVASALDDLEDYDHLQDPYVGYSGFDAIHEEFVQQNRTGMSDEEIELMITFTHSDWIIQDYADRLEILIEADHGDALLGICGDVLTNQSGSIRENHMKFVCAIHGLGRKCAAHALNKNTGQ